MKKREGIIPPKFADKFFRIDFESEPLPVLCLYPIPPVVTLDDVRLEVCGLEEHPRLIPWSSLSSLPRIKQDIPIICQLFNWYENVQWEGIRLVDLIDHLRVDAPIDGYFAFYSRDGVYFETLSRDEARDPRVLLAFGLNGEPLPEQHGGPLRLVVPFLQGYKSVKCLGGIRVFRNDPIGIKRLLGQSPSGQLNDAWVKRLGVVVPSGKAGDPPPLGAPASASGILSPAKKEDSPTHSLSAPRIDVLLLSGEPSGEEGVEVEWRSEKDVLCEIMVIVRPERRQATQKALEEGGFLSYSTYGVLGRGRQKGLKFKGEETSEAAIRFLPRQMFMFVVKESSVNEAVEIIKKANQSGKKGQFGDGKIFVLKMETAIRISTGETGEDAI
ncbi:MAG: molybdopterin-dependent oxidoreductase [Leptospirillum sp.]